MTPFYICAACSHIFKWCDERKPNYCPECGVYPFKPSLASEKPKTLTSLLNEEMKKGKRRA